MKYATLLCVLFAAALCSDVTVNDAPLVDDCRRAMTFMVRGEYVSSCVYLCEGLPFQAAREYDGTPCVKIVDGVTTPGFCKDGECELVEAAGPGQ